MTALDIFVLLTLGGAAMVGFVRGFAHEVLALIAWIVAIAALKLFHTPLTMKLTGITGGASGAAVLAFALLFLPTYLGTRLFARAVGVRTRRSLLGPVDRVLGGGFGMLKGLIGATMVFLLANLAVDLVYGGTAPRPDWMAKSRNYPLLNASGKAIVDWVQTRQHPGVKL